MHKIFLSHSHKDSPYALTVKDHLIKGGFEVLSLDDTIAFGESIATNLQHMIQKCDVFIALISPDSMNSRWIHMEMGAAWALNKRVIPILIRDTRIEDLSLPLANFKVMRIKSEADLESVLQKLVAEIRD